MLTGIGEPLQLCHHEPLCADDTSPRVKAACLRAQCDLWSQGDPMHLYLQAWQHFLAAEDPTAGSQAACLSYT